MRFRLRNLLRCPACRGRLDVAAFATAPDGDIVDGELHCGCGACYPIVDTIPRMLPNAYAEFPDFVLRYRERVHRSAPVVPQTFKAAAREHRLLARTQRSFGYQWTTFSEMVCDFRENFWNYLQPATPESFNGRLGLDAGCGFGRHIYHAAMNGAEMVGVDLSRAIDATRRNTQHLPNVHLVQADLCRPPFEDGTFDFVYSLGVLHHLPDPARGTQALAKLLRPGGMMFIWVYSSRRRIMNALLEAARSVTTRLPHPLLRPICWLGAVVDWCGFVLPYRALRRIPAIGTGIERLTPARVRVYSRYPFQVLEADWFDRLAAPVRFYYDASGAETLIRSVGLADVQVSATGLYGWRVCGVNPATPVPAATKELEGTRAQ